MPPRAEAGLFHHIRRSNLELDRELLMRRDVSGKASSSKPLRVCVVAQNPETIDALHDYLSRAGVSSYSSRRLVELDLATSHTSLLVLFPDEFDREQVCQAIAELRAAHRRLPILLITGAPQHYSHATLVKNLTPPPIVLPKPAFGWTILEAIRAHARPGKT
jgi:hypothetical protein